MTTPAGDPAILAPVHPRLAPPSTCAGWIRWLIASLLFLQLATAAHACRVGLNDGPSQSMAGMPCAEAMDEGTLPTLDPEQPGLCIEHCEAGAQTVDAGGGTVLPVAALFPLYAVPAAAAGSANSHAAWQARLRTRAASPPPAHSVLHCCYRL